MYPTTGKDKFFGLVGGVPKLVDKINHPQQGQKNKIQKEKLTIVATNENLSKHKVVEMGPP